MVRPVLALGLHGPPPPACLPGQPQNMPQILHLAQDKTQETKRRNKANVHQIKKTEVHP